MKRTLMSALAVAVLLGGACICPAQDSSSESLKPVAVVSFSGYDEILKDLEFIGKLAGDSELATNLEMMLKAATDGKGLAGLDTTKPWGFVVQTDGQQFQMHGFVPVTDLKELLGVLGTLGEFESKDAGDGVMEIEAGNQTVFVKQSKSGWAFIAPSADAFAKMPKDPVKALGGLNEKYDLAVRVAVKNVPPMFRQMALAPLQMGVQMGMQRQPGESDEQFAIRSKVAQQAIGQMSTMINELDTLMIGLAVDRQTGTSYLDYEATAVEGTKTAEQMAQAKDTKTNFAGFQLPGAALAANVVGTLGKADVAQVESTVAMARTNAMDELKKQGLSDEELKLAEQMVTDLMDVLEATVKSGQIDGGMALLLDPSALTVVVGGHLADTAKLDGLVKRLAEQIIKDQPDAAKAIKLDAGEHEGVRFHTIAVPVDELDAGEQVEQLLGDTLELVVGIGEDAVYLAAGRDAMKTLEQVIDKSKAEAGKPCPPMQISVAATPIAKFVAAVADDDQAKAIGGLLAGLLDQAAGKDRITLTSKAIPNGAQVRLELEEGILKVLGSVPKMVP